MEIEVKLKFEVEFKVENEVEVKMKFEVEVTFNFQLLTELDQTKLNSAMTQLKSNLVNLTS